MQLHIRSHSDSASRDQRRYRLASGALLLALGLLPALASSPASAAGDVTPPAITANTNAGFVVGSVISAANFCATHSWDQLTSVQEYINYTVRDQRRIWIATVRDVPVVITMATRR